MILPSSALGDFTQTVAFFECEIDDLANWLEGTFGDIAPVVTDKVIGEDSLLDFAESVLDKDVSTRYLLATIGPWCAMLNNTVLGTDVGILHIHAAKRCGWRAVRAVAQPDGPQPAVMVELTDPSSTHRLGYRRTIAAASDGGAPIFWESGDRLPFEDPERFENQDVLARFSVDDLEVFLEGVGIPVGTTSDRDLARSIRLVSAC